MNSNLMMNAARSRLCAPGNSPTTWPNIPRVFSDVRSPVPRAFLVGRLAAERVRQAVAKFPELAEPANVARRNHSGAALLEGRQAASGMTLLAYWDSWTRRRSWARW